MPLNNAKQYNVIVPAGQRVSVTPAGARRVLLEIQNTGANEVKYRWENAVQNDGGDFLLAPRERIIYREPCPVAALNLYSVAGSTVAILEVTE